MSYQNIKAFRLNNENIFCRALLQWVSKGIYMQLYLAGGISGNLRKFWEIFLAEPSSRKEIVESMEIFLARQNGKKRILEEQIQNGAYKNLGAINILESFYYLRKNEDFMRLKQYFHSFLLDSGAFTFLAGSHKGSIDWDRYTEEYAEFINKWGIMLFFELDIDSIVGISQVERLREKLESLTGKKPIPVWHKYRSKEYFIQMCKSYPYVAIGGIITKELPRQLYEQAFPWFINTAHKHGAKIHGLGYTNIEGLKKYRFDSVDSSSWLHGNIGGYIYRFNPYTVKIEQYQKAGHRLKTHEAALNNFNEWVKFGIYAEENL